MYTLPASVAQAAASTALCATTVVGPLRKILAAEPPRTSAFSCWNAPESALQDCGLPATVHVSNVPFTRASVPRTLLRVPTNTAPHTTTAIHPVSSGPSAARRLVH